ncbi:hypothetical protein [Bacillus paranthracis]|uniref:Uncharacterized protein n=1 Tax=Bacillus paranthracis TaxID=2026186 RepID=A0AAX3QMF8_9BACI|nr:hypothetical protein [Bacillus paranthracis]WES09618.1 hypothetical protein P3K65_27725 [Bacillus paranthracis]
MKKVKNKQQDNLKEIKEEKIRLEEKRDRNFDRVIRIGDIAVRILIWIFKD